MGKGCQCSEVEDRILELMGSKSKWVGRQGVERLGRLRD